MEDVMNRKRWYCECYHMKWELIWQFYCLYTGTTIQSFNIPCTQLIFPWGTYKCTWKVKVVYHVYYQLYIPNFPIFPIFWMLSIFPAWTNGNIKGHTGLYKAKKAIQVWTKLSVSLFVHLSVCLAVQCWCI